MKIKWSYFAISTLLLAALSARAEEFTFAARHLHLLKDCHGTLQINSEGVAFEASKKKDSRTWAFNDIRVFEIISPTQISLVTYEDQKRWAGKDRVFEFVLLDRKAAPDLSAFLLNRIKRPMKLAVIPENLGKPDYELAVKHLHAVSGTRGMLRIYSDKIVYATTTAGDSRYWRMEDIQRIGQPDRFRFEIVSHIPQAGGPTEAYQFQLIEDLPEGILDYLWVRLHPSSYYPPKK